MPEKNFQKGNVAFDDDKTGGRHTVKITLERIRPRVYLNAITRDFETGAEPFTYQLFDNFDVIELNGECERRLIIQSENVDSLRIVVVASVEQNLKKNDYKGVCGGVVGGDTVLESIRCPAFVRRRAMPCPFDDPVANNRRRRDRRESERCRKGAIRRPNEVPCVLCRLGRSKLGERERKNGDVKRLVPLRTSAFLRASVYRSSPVGAIVARLLLESFVSSLRRRFR